MADFHREWMVEQAALAGFALEDSLPPTPIRGPHRDYSGRVQPRPQTLTTDAVEEVAADSQPARIASATLGYTWEIDQLGIAHAANPAHGLGEPV